MFISVFVLSEIFDRAFLVDYSVYFLADNGVRFEIKLNSLFTWPMSVTATVT